MAKIKSHDLIGPALDYAVALYAGGAFRMHTPRGVGDCTPFPVIDWPTSNYWTALTDYSPSTDWAIGGPIVDREGITCERQCRQWRSGILECRSYGKTALVAAMRSIVALRVGLVVEIP